MLLPASAPERRADRAVLQLSKYPALNNFEKQTSVPKVYALLGLAAVYFFLIFFNIAGELLVNIAGFIIPGYYSLNALFSASKVDDTQVSFSRAPFAAAAPVAAVAGRPLFHKPS